MGVSSDRQLGRPKEWDGKETTFDDFSFKFSNWLSGLPGGEETLLENAARHAGAISVTTMTVKQAVIARGIAMSLKSLVSGKALDIIKAVEQKTNGFEMWRRLHLEYKPHTSSRTVSLLEAVMEDKPRGTEDFSVWYYRWLELIRQAEQARGKLIDDDIKCAVATRRSPK